ncbi:nucleoside-diphosphate sugar epimerase/dehydratase [Motiliproteus sp. MSK22-1]|uniref:polysaccharide biosynthesis protein n=1 Tax=Motiliproteus sp. MSK22-1 TaxID=1897630 RepID=UPI000975EFB3|nr:nucleoside-diphosphate sugar epimerase/dehydratase [Motiliproteus sp. MSK22-1]OMH30903.1 hypothetical protein BGP75_00785 [Motiliproteus sp. MSK22-1]
MLSHILRLDRLYKAALVALMDSCLVIISLWVAYSLRLGELYVPAGSQWLLFAVAPVIAVPVFVRMGLYRAVIRYIGHRAMLTIAYANAVLALLWSLLPFYLPNYVDIQLFSPRSLPFIFWMVLCITVGGSRQVARWFISDLFRSSQGKYILIYGAGEAGVQLASSLSHSHSLRLLGFIDDDQKLHGHQVAGLQVYGGQSAIAGLKDSCGSLEVLLAMPSASREDRRRIVDGLERFEVAVRTMPSLDDIALGRADLTELYDVGMAELLGREEVTPDASLLSRCVSDRHVLVSGAGGTIGSELCRQILLLKPTRLILLEHSEFLLYRIEDELQKRVHGYNLAVEVIAVLGTVLDRGLVAKLLRTYNVTTVYHAAAYKHVPIVEHNILAGVRNNVIGTYNMAMEALNEGVENFVLVSTDKAVRPTNTMGASKRLAEMVLQGLHDKQQKKNVSTASIKSDQQTCFSMVRFGNVLGSSGSVIPLFKDQIAQGGPVTVTHPDITRYFMTIPEAALLVIQAGSMGEGGDLFVLDMGEPVKIAELAARMIRLSGYQVGNNEGNGIAIEYTGLRHGEKLFEELLIGDNVRGTQHPLIMVADEKGPECQDIGQLVSTLDGYLKLQDVEKVRQFLLDQVSGYLPQCGIEDTLWLETKRLETKQHN